MTDWIWPAVSALLVLLLALSWMRKRGDDDAPEPARAKPARKPDPEPEKRSAPAKTTKPAAERKPAEAKPAERKKKEEPAQALPTLEYEDDEEVDPTRVGAGAATKQLKKLAPPTKKILYDEDAALEEPTQSAALILVTSQAQTDRGLRRKRNEDSILAMPEHGVFAVADGMGGYQGGEIASAIAVKTLEDAFRKNAFDGDAHDSIPPRASELARAIQMANEAILERAQQDKNLEGMGTTICAVRFAANKQRLYVGHVGDSRLYRIRDGQLRRMTSDHTMKDLGVTGPQGAHLSRAVGIWPTVPIDIVLGKPRPGDLYILCSDGLTKMVPDDMIASVAAPSKAPSTIVEELIDTANARGGKDNVSVIVIRVLNAQAAGR